MEWNNFNDFQKQDFKNEKELTKHLDETIEILNNNKNDWKKREASIKSIGSISLGNQARSKTFIKYFNQKICFCFQIQILDLRSSLMKEACRALVLCTKNLGNLIEPALERLISTNTLFKVINTANKLISETGVKTIRKIIKNIESEKILIKILEQIKSKGSQIRLACIKALIIALKYYNEQIFLTVIDAFEEFIRVMVHDANGEVRLFARKLFLIFREIFPQNAERIFGLFELAMQKALIEDMKKFDVHNISSESEGFAEDEFENEVEYKNENYADNNFNNNNNNDNRKIEKGIVSNNNKNFNNRNEIESLPSKTNYKNDFDKFNPNNFEFNRTEDDKGTETNYSNNNIMRKTEAKIPNTNSPLRTNYNYVNTNNRNSIYNFNEDENFEGFNYIQTENLMNKRSSNIVQHPTNKKIANEECRTPERRKSYDLKNFNNYLIETENNYIKNSKNSFPDPSNQKQERKSNYLEEQIVLLKNNDIIKNSKYFKDLYKGENNSGFNDRQIEEFTRDKNSNNYIDDKNNNKMNENKHFNKYLNSSFYNKNLIETKDVNDNHNNYAGSGNRKSLNTNKTPITNNSNNKISQQANNKGNLRSSISKSTSGTPSKIVPKTKINENKLNDTNEKNINSKNQAGKAGSVKNLVNLNKKENTNNINKNNIESYNNNNLINENEENYFLKKGNYNNNERILTPSDYSNQTAITENYNNLGKNFEIDEFNNLNANLDKFSIKDNLDFYNYINNKTEADLVNTANSQHNKKFSFVPKGKLAAKYAVENSNIIKGNDILLETENENKFNLKNNLNIGDEMSVNNNKNEIANQRLSLQNPYFDDKNENKVKSSLIQNNPSNNETRYSYNNYPIKENSNYNNFNNFQQQNNNKVFKTKSQNIEANVSDILKQLAVVGLDIQTKTKLLENVSSIFNDIYSNIETLNKPLIKSLIDFHIANYNINLNNPVYFNFSDLLSSQINNKNPNKNSNYNQNEINDNSNIKENFNSKNFDLLKSFINALIKNLSKFIFYLPAFFTNENFIFVIKISILNSIKYKDIAQTTQAILDVIKAKVDSLIIFTAVFQLVDAEASDEILDSALNWTISLIPSTEVYFKNEKNLFEFFMRLIEILKTGNFATQSGSSIKFKIFDALEVLFNIIPDMFLLVFNNYLDKEDRSFLDFHLQKNKGIFYQKLKSKSEGDLVKNDKNKKPNADEIKTISVTDKKFTFEKNTKNENNFFDKYKINKNEEEEFYKKSLTNQPKAFTNDLVNIKNVNNKIDMLLEAGNSDYLNKNALDFLNKNLNLFSKNDSNNKIIDEKMPKVVEFDLFNDSVESYSSKHVTPKISSGSVNNNNKVKLDKNKTASNNSVSISSTSMNKTNNNLKENDNTNAAKPKNNLRNSMQSNNINNNNNNKHQNKKEEGDIVSMLHAGEYAYFLYFISSNPDKNIKDFLSQLSEIKLNQVDKIILFLHDSLRDPDYAYLYNSSLEVLIEQIIFIYEKFFDEEINDDFKDLFTSLSHFCDADLYIQYSARHLNFKKSNSLILLILQTMRNSIMKIEAEKLLLLLPTFIDVLFEFLNHHTSDVRKLAVLCAVEIYFILGEDFESYLNYANQSQRNLINIFYKKKLQDKKV